MTAALRVGAHVSIAGGLDQIFVHGRAAGCDVVQLFTKSSRQWRARPLREPDLATFARARAASDIEPALAHDSYLINLAAPSERAWRRACRAFADEYRRAGRLGIPYLVTHPGAHLGRGDAFGIRRIAAALNGLTRDGEVWPTVVLLETTAGQGSSLGHRFAHLRDILGLLDRPERFGVCVDTCHVFAAGYDIRTAAGWQTTFAELDRVIGCAQVRAFHVNDSRAPLGARVDRHEHLGRGAIGLAAFHALVNDRRFIGLPMTIETPKPTPYADRINLAILRALHGRRRISARARRLATQSLRRAPVS